MSDFLPTSYKLPQAGGGYMKLQQGENVLRVLSAPIIGWLDWEDKHPHRFRMDNKPAKSFDPNRPVKHFWAMVVWNYNDKAVQILEITQSGIQKAIKALVDDEDWGKPFEYDIKIKREGEGLDTIYTVNPKPKKALADDIKAEYAKKNIRLEALYDGENPFEESSDIKLDDIAF